MTYFSISELNLNKLPLSPEVTKNLQFLISKLDLFRGAYGKPFIINSGYRDSKLQSKVNPLAPKSKHCFGLAVDVCDKDNLLMNWILKNLELAKDLDLFFEDFRYTPNWCHLQVGKPKSGKRIFIPSSGQPPCNRWNGKYDKKFDLS